MFGRCVFVFTAASLAGCMSTQGVTPPTTAFVAAPDDVSNARCGIGKITIFKGPNGGTGGVNITAGFGHALWYGDIGLNEIVKMNEKGHSVGYHIPTPDAVPEGIAKSGKRMWFTEWNQAKIGSSSAKGRIREFGLTALAGSGSKSVAMVGGPDNRIWFTTGSLGLGAMTRRGVPTFYTTGIDSEDPSGVAVGPDKNLWFTTFTGPDIGKMTTGGVATTYNVGANGGFGLTAGPDGRVWFADPQHHRIGAINTDGTGLVYYNTGSSPYNIVTAKNHYMYFTTATKARIGRISVTGAVKACRIRAPRLFDALGITIGPDGNVWVLDNRHSQVARLKI